MYGFSHISKISVSLEFQGYGIYLHNEKNRELLQRDERKKKFI